MYFGNRNWHPLVEDTVAEMARDGVRSALVFATSAYGGYSGCRQYHEDIARARGPRSATGAPELVKLRHFFDHPRFVAANADAVRAARAHAARRGPRRRPRWCSPRTRCRSPRTPRAGTPADGGHRYSRQVAEAARLVAAELRRRRARPRLAVPVRAAAGAVARARTSSTTSTTLRGRRARPWSCARSGFVSDHVEVVWDLDTEARERAEELGVAFARAATAGPDPRFAEMVVELVAEHTAAAAPRGLSADVPSAGCTVNGLPCAVDCCAPTRRPAGR